MDKNAIKKYAVWARRELIERVSQRAMIYGITAKDAGDPNAESVNGHLLSQAEKRQRQALIRNIKTKGYEQVMEEVAYTWFNRFAALRFMEVNGYLPSHIRVFTNDAGEFKPQILAEAIHLELEGLDMNKVYELESANKSEELFKYLLIVQCNALNSILPGMFQRIEDYTELLLPDYLLREGSVIDRLIADISEKDFDINAADESGQIEIIGWLYQYYNDEKKAAVIDMTGKAAIEKNDVPAATQLFTTDWVVRYIVDNSVGRYWIERNPNSSIKSQLPYLVSPKNGALPFVSESVSPQDISVLDPCVGSGHFLVYAFDVLMKIYEEYGYSEREAAKEIVEHNLYGLDIDERAVQLAYFAIMMKARKHDRRFLTRNIQPHIYSFVESNGIELVSVQHLGGNLSQEEYSIAIEQAKQLIREFIDAKEYGSILHITKMNWDLLRRFAALSYTDNQIKLDIYGEQEASDQLLQMIDVAEVMSTKYTVVATNPPYLNKFDAKLKNYVLNHYKDYSGDLFSVFMYRNGEFCKTNGYYGFMTPYVWMFIKTYEPIRKYIINEKAICTLVQMEYSAFEEATVPICSFVLMNGHPSQTGKYFRLTEFRGGMRIQNEKLLEAQADKDCGYYYETEQREFFKIESSPIAYWADEKLLRIFESSKPLRQVAEAKVGLQTGENNLFLRMWYEVDNGRILYHADSAESAQASGYKWFPYNKGGAYRKWYGNNDYVVNWQNDGWDIKHFFNEKGKLKSRPQNTAFYFRPAITWSYNTSGLFNARIKDQGFIFDVNGVSLFIEDESKRKYLLGFLCSSVASDITSMLNPTINMQVGDMQRVPIVFDDAHKDEIVKTVDECIDITRTDWDAKEISWDFRTSILIRKGVLKIAVAVEKAAEEYESRFERLKRNEEYLNQVFSEIYGVDQYNVPVQDSDVSVQLLDKTEAIKDFISYAVGCIMGRYSLDTQGVVYTGGAWDASKYKTFIPDRDAILPICDDEYFEDDIVGRFVKFVETAYGKETLEENLRYIADALGGKGSSREVIRNYFINDFYADHLKMYQKRPIYWLFDSGKKNGFKCLIYVHRYQPDTIARIRTDYVHEQQSRYRTAITDLEQRINGASTSERVKLNKQLATLQAQAEEIRVYEEKIHHLADQMIKIDLDDGVKHNYEIFKDVLAKIK